MYFMTSKLWIHEDYISEFRDKGIDQFPVMYNSNFAVLIRGEHRKSVKYFSLQKGAQEIGFYLKKQHVTFSDHVKTLLRKRKIFKLTTTHEKELIDFYVSQQVPVARVVAWVEVKFLCFPLRGVLVQEEVKGLEFVDLLKDGDRLQRIQLIKAYGRLIGELHAKGIFSSVVRVTDIICTPPDSESSIPYKLVIIDRERGQLCNEDITLDRISSVLANVLVRFVLYIDMPTLREVCTFLDSYVSALKNVTPLNAKNLCEISQKKFDVLMNSYDHQV